MGRAHCAEQPKDSPLLYSLQALVPPPAVSLPPIFDFGENTKKRRIHGISSVYHMYMPVNTSYGGFNTTLVTSIQLEYYIGEFNTTLVFSILPQYSGMYWVVLSLNTILHARRAAWDQARALPRPTRMASESHWQSRFPSQSRRLGLKCCVARPPNRLHSCTSLHRHEIGYNGYHCLKCFKVCRA